MDLKELSKRLPRGVYQLALQNITVLHLKSIYFSPDEIAKYQRWRKTNFSYDSDDDTEPSSRGLAWRTDSCESKAVYATAYSTMEHNEDMILPGAVTDPNHDQVAANEELMLSREGTTKALTTILSSCPLVEDLALCFIDDYRSHRCKEQMPYIPLLNMLENNTLTKLRKLEVVNCRMEEAQIVGALLLCASTIDELKLEEIILGRGTWESALDRLIGRFRQLIIQVGDLYSMGREWEASVRAYGIRRRRFAFGYYFNQYPVLICIGSRELMDWLTGRSLVNPAQVYMNEGAAREAAEGSDDDTDDDLTSSELAD